MDHHTGTLAVPPRPRYNDVGLGRPPRRTAEVTRDGLLALYAEHRHRKLVLISGPAGYGKSILAAQCCTVDPSRPSMWAGISDADNDPAVLVARLTVGVERLLPVGQGRARRPEGADGAVNALLHAVAERSAFLLVLDDFHHLENPGSVQVIHRLIDALPSEGQVVIVSRSDPDLGLARRRANGELLEIRSDALAMDLDTTTQFLAAAQVDIDAEAIAGLHEKTEGWPAGIGLAALSHDGRSAVVYTLAEVSGAQREIADYLFEEVLSRQADPVRRFLLRTSVLSALTGDLCDAVLGVQGSRTMLQELEQTNLFLIPLDNHRGWFRYHHLFQDMLLAELYRTEPQSRRTLLERAAAWHDGEGTVLDALRYAQEIGDVERVGRLVLSHWEEFAASGQIETLRTWVRRSTDEEIAADPCLAIGAGWVFTLLGDAERAERAAAAAAQHELDVPSPDGATSLRSALANLRTGLGSGGIGQMLEDGRFVQAAERPTRTRWLLGGCRAVGISLVLLGRPDDAIVALDEAILLTEERAELRSARILCLGYVALAHLEKGRVDRAAELVAEADALIGEDGVANTFQSLPARVAKSSVRLRQGDRDGAAAEVVATVERLDVAAAAPWMLGDLALRCAEVSLEVRDLGSAIVLLDRARQALVRLPDAGTMPERLAHLEHRTNQVEPILDTLTPAERRILPLLASHLTLAEIGAQLFVSRSTVKTHVLSIYSKLGVSTRTEAVAKTQL